LTASIHAVTTLIDEEGNARIFIALGDAHDYGARTLWEDDIVDSREQEDDEF
jgi:hypothetical protein